MVIQTNINTLEPLINYNNYLEIKNRLPKAHEDAKPNLISSELKRKESYDKSINPVCYQKGDIVLI